MSGSAEAAPGSSAELRFAEVETLQDLSTYVARARSLDADGALRLQARGTALAAWVQVLPGQGLLGAGLVLGLRVMHLDRPHEVDVTVPLSAMSDRLARRPSAGDVSAVLSIPPVTVSPSWAAISPPQGGWQLIGTIADDALLAASGQGIEEVAEGTPPGAGAAAVATLRARVWGRELPLQAASSSLSADAVGSVPAGTGLAAYALGFARAGQTSSVFSSGAWTRVSLRNGEILTR